MSTSTTEICLGNNTNRQNGAWLVGFFLLGSLLGLLGSLLVVWRYHLSGDPGQAGLHFLGLDLGYIFASLCSTRIVARLGVRRLAQSSCLLAALGLAALPLVAPPTSIGWRLSLMGMLGVSAGALATALLHVLQSSYQASPTVALTRSALVFSAGSLFVTAVTGTIYAAGKSGWEIAVLASIPVVTMFVFVRAPERSEGARAPGKSGMKTRNLRVIATILFSLLLFFQFGNEWAIAGWLPILLVRRLGTDPTVAILSLALYFLFVALGRIVAQTVLQIVGHRRLLLASIVTAMLGYALLALTHTMSAAFTGIVLIGFGFGPIFPLLGENLDDRFVFQPGLYNGIFSFAITGAMAAPWLLGYVLEYLGNEYLLLIPTFGSVAVFVLALLLMLEARLMRGTPPAGRRSLLS